jgi:PAS domain S-box-containing protein
VEEAIGKSRIDILIVDDRPENLLALEAVLSDDGYNLIKAGSGTEALRFLLDHECAIILMDVQMPEMDGYETATLIKRSERYRDIPIIFITALNKEERFVHQGYRSGAVDYVFKPFDAEILRSKVAVFADLFRKNQEIHRQAALLRDADRRERERELARLELKSLKREQASQRRYRELVDGLRNAIIWSAEPETLQFSFVSPSAERIVGFAPEAWISEPGFWFNRLPGGEISHVRQRLRDAVASLGEVQFEHRLLKAQGGQAWFRTSVRLVPRVDSPDERYELQGLSVDITDLKEAENALHRSETRARILAEASLLMSQSLDYETTLEGIGRLTVREFADWYSVDTVEEGSEDVACIASAMSEQRLDAADAPAFRARYLDSAPVRSFLRDTAQKARSHILPACPLFASALTVPLLARGRVIGFMSFARGWTGGEGAEPFDASDLVMAEDFATRVTLALENSRLYQAARLAIQARDEFLSIASHELKTPLTPLRLQTQAVLRMIKNRQLHELEPERLIKMVQTSDKQITRIAQLIEDLLDVSRINGGRLTFELEEFDLGALVQEVVDRFATQIQADGCTVRIDASPAATGKWDRFRVEQVVVNLLTNALKYGAGQPIEIRVGAHPDGVAIEVRDHGIGIAKADQERIFRRFERAVSSTYFGGLGLGLFIVSEILRAHGGRIEVESEEKRGSLFRAILPADSSRVAGITSDLGGPAHITAPVQGGTA